MPIVVGPGGIITPPPGPTPPPPGPPPIISDLPAATWIDPYRAVVPLTNLQLGWITTTGVAGLNAVPITLNTDAQDEGGVSVRNIIYGPRFITWPLYVEGRTRTEFLSRWRSLMRSFTSTSRLGPGTLVMAQPDGTQRRIRAYYQDGFDGDPDGGIRWDIAVLTLMCPDPWWFDPQPIPIIRTYTTTGAPYFNPYPTVSRSRTFGNTTVLNPGDAPAWPNWKLTGPASRFAASNLRRGESWTLDVSAYRGSALGSGEVITITSQPPTVTGPDGSSWYGALTGSPVLWRLDEGASRLNFTVTSPSAGAAIEGEFYARRESA